MTMPQDPRRGAPRPRARKSAVRPRSGRLGALALGLLILLLVGCGAAAPEPEVDQAEIQEMLEDYLPRLGRAYGERNPKLLADLAVPKEQARIQLRIQELEDKGQIYEPIFQTVTVESVSVWGYSNAYATTLEEWDVSAYTLGSRQLVNQSLGQRSRVKYQLKRKDEGWVVLYRELEQAFDS
ncbi:MAG: hypothetical protein AAF725_24570 [Acidobacteriota bacterium]